MNQITQQRLSELLDYNLETGVFTWIKKTSKKIVVGDEAGSFSHGYKRIRIDKTDYQAHRLAWLYVYSVMPDDQIDHINGNRADNRILNLRCATNAENNRNIGRQKNNTSGFVGVTFDKRRNSWKARCTVDGVEHYLGSFKSKNDASTEYVNFAKIHHGEFFPIGLPTAF